MLGLCRLPTACLLLKGYRICRIPLVNYQRKRPCGVEIRSMASVETAAAQVEKLSLNNSPAVDGAPAQSIEDVKKQKAAYYQKRIQIFEQFKAREDAQVAAAAEANEAISITLPSGDVKQGVKGVTTPLEVAESISKGLAKKCVSAKVNDKKWDLFRPLPEDCTLTLFTFSDPEGKDTFWHSSSHILGQALELEFGVDLTIGPSIEEGFYYDAFLGDKTLSDSQKDQIEKRMLLAAKEKQEFQRVEVTRDEALTMFQENKFKVEIISNLPADAIITLYRVGPMVDLCTGPHLPNTSFLKAVSVTNLSRSHWRADVTKEPLQRVYGVTFPDAKMMKEYKHRIEEAQKRDHRLLGTNQELFFFNRLSPGSCFFLPHGTRIYNTLKEYIRGKYWEYNYDEVVTPNIYNFDLWKTSGHADHYKENMFAFDIEKQEFGLKPMNCPGHCVMFGHRNRSYRELPLRLADFGVLHRNEFSGALHGLTRVRRFEQDDAHIFCMPEQVRDEVSAVLKMLDEVYGVFGLQYELRLSTRPEKYMGDLALWDQAEADLKGSLDATGLKWELNPGDGAFYGPKIDVTVFDALRRKFQCATIQLDFQLPIRFDLKYQTAATSTDPNLLFGRPVMVHRAILGSVERMFAILTEHYAGKWPFWISPRQVAIVPVSQHFFEYAEQVKKTLDADRFYVDVDTSSNTLQNKIRLAQGAQYNYILVVGEQEMNHGSVNVRVRDTPKEMAQQLEMPVAELTSVLQKERATFSLQPLIKMPPAPARKPAPAPAAAAPAAETS